MAVFTPVSPEAASTLLHKLNLGGLVALAVSCWAAMPISKAARPASTAVLKATAIRFGSDAMAMAEALLTAR